MNGRTIMGTACAAAVVTALAYGSPEDGRRWRAEANAKMAAVAADACGRRVTARIDWAALDTLDYHGEDKNDTIGSVDSTVESMHDGLARACQDPEVKANLAAVGTIVFVPTGDKTYTLDATILGSTLTFTDYIFGSTRNIDDFAVAVAGAKPPDPPKESAPVKLGTPSSKWDATYRNEGGFDGRSMCLSASTAGDIKVSGGKLTIPWRIADFRVESQDRPMLDVGRIDAVVHADGTGVGVVTFANPALDAPEPRTVKMKRVLESVRSVALKFVHTDDGRAFTFSIQLAGTRWTCDYRWIWDDPKIAAARRAEYERAEAAKTPAQRAAERRAAEHATKCRATCDQHRSSCNDRCSDSRSACARKCDDISDYETRTTRCPQACDAGKSACENSCDSESTQCGYDCER
jgi:hypothetical protein